MYTVPAKVAVQTKTLIDAFEKGQLASIITEEEDQPPVRPHHPELYVDELAEPGTAKKLLQAFEFRREHSETSSSESAKSPTITGKLSVDRFLSFESKSPLEKRSMINGFLNGNALEMKKQDGVEIGTTVNEESAGDNAIEHVEGNNLVEKIIESSVNIPDHAQSVIINVTKVENDTSNAAMDVHQENVEVKTKEENDEQILHTVQEQSIANEIKEEMVCELNKANNNNDPQEMNRDNIEDKTDINQVKERVEINVEEKNENNVVTDQIVTETTIIISSNGDLLLNDVADVKTSEDIMEKVDQRIVEEIVETIESKTEQNVEEKIDGGPVDSGLSSTLAVETLENVADQVTTGQEFDNAAASTEVTLEEENTGNEKTVKSVKRTILFVSAVKPENSLDTALREASVQVLASSGHDIIVTDVFSAITPVAYNEERRRLLEADLIIFHYRPILNSPPALLKSWLEGTLIQEDGSPVDKALLEGKKAIVLLTSAESVPDDQLIETLPFLSSIQDPVLKAYSMDVLYPFTIFGVHPNLTENELTEHSEKWIERLTSVWNESS